MGDEKSGERSIGEDAPTLAATGTAMTGRKAFGKHQPFATLGSGGMADVFLAIRSTRSSRT